MNITELNIHIVKLPFSDEEMLCAARAAQSIEDFGKQLVKLTPILESLVKEFPDMVENKYPEPTERGLKDYPEGNGYYIANEPAPNDYPCTCADDCPISCKGTAASGCKSADGICAACHAAYVDFGYS